MAIDLDRAIQIKELLENGSIHNILPYAQRSYPNECCGFVLESGAVFPAQNIIDTIHNQSLTAKNAFMIDGESWFRAASNPSPIICVYHSHTNGDANMSDADQHMLRWHDLFYLIIGLIDTNPTSAKLFWWNEGNLSELDIQL